MSGGGFTGVLTGRRFSYDPGRTLQMPGRGGSMAGHYEGVDEDGQPVYIRSAAELSPIDAPTVRRVRHAIDVARHEAVRGCRSIVQLIDHDDQVVEVYGFGANYDVVSAAWEWADRVLLDELIACDGDREQLAASVEATVGAALTCLHAAGSIHSDVAPNNVVRVGGVWKLADLDSVVKEGEPIIGMPKDPRYRLPAVDVGDPARREMDEYGLRAILSEIVAGPE